MSKNGASRRDRSTFSNYTAAVSTKLHLEWTLNFETRTISGYAIHTIKVLTQGTSTVIFDSSKLHIVDVSIDGNPVSFAVGEVSPALGSSVTVSIPEALRKAGSQFDVVFEYSTDPQASAVQWLAPEATAGGKKPYVFTQCQAIHARSLMPCQDSPGVKIPYSATVRAPAWCVVLMSALQDHARGSEPGVFYWNQPNPTPAYLVALAAGDLQSRELSPRVKVWAEPSVVEAAAYEFADTEAFLTTAESLTCPYAWSRYDILCLPPSFPYGGMENPCLTFATPTLLAGDRSLADVIAHEIAHSWTGNLITNCTWEHFWLNEGWTVWLERKIMARVKGDDAHRLLSSQIGWKHLKDDVSLFGETNKFTRLVWPLSGEDPDDAFSGVPYEKGYNFLTYLEGVVGTPDFETFAKAYINQFKFQTVSSDDFKDFFMKYFEGNKAVSSINWDEAYYTEGMPKFTNDFSNHLSEAAINLSNIWLQWAEKSHAPWGVGASDINGWSTQQKCVFLERLLDYTKEKAPLSLSILENLDLAYGFTATTNSEIKFRWQSLCLRSNAPWIVDSCVQFITSQGRMKYVRPLYRALFQSTVGKAAATKTFLAHNQMYHPIARKMVAADLKLDLNKSPAVTPSTPRAPPVAEIIADVAGAPPAKWIVPLAVVSTVAAAFFVQFFKPK